MSLSEALADLSATVVAFLAAAARTGGQWKIPRAPGKWSPSQVAEHVARIMEESAKVAAGSPSKFPTIPIFLRPVVRLIVFRRIIRRKSFLKMKALEPFQPEMGVGSPSEAMTRLQATLAQFDSACRAREATGRKVDSTIFGAVSVADFARFQELHVRHHLQQLPGEE
ncbi:MAG: DUF1569 domain-containing protein [Gemmatimonadales bacterium]